MLEKLQEEERVRIEEEEKQAILEEEAKIKLELELELQQDRMKFQEELKMIAQKEALAKDLQNHLYKQLFDGVLRLGLKDIYAAQMTVLWTLRMWVHRRRYLKIRNNNRLLNRRPPPTKEEAVTMIERAWIRFRIRDEARKMRETLKGVPYECRRSYVKYFDLKFKTIRLQTDVETFSRSIR